jgi:hypothetical protein
MEVCMELTEERRTELLAYCKLTELAADEEVISLIPLYYAASVGYLEGAGIAEPEKGTALRSQYDLLVNALVLDKWDHRELSVQGTAVIENPALRQLINQMKMRGVTG